MTIPNIRAIIFDLDGTIIESEAIHHELEREIFRRLGIAVSPEEHSSFTGMAGDRMWVTLKERHAYAHSIDDVRIWVRRLFYDHFDSADNKIILVDGVQKLIEDFSAQGFKMAVASSSSSAYVRMMMLHFGLTKHFHQLCGGDSALNSKPAPDLFLYAAEQLDVDPGQCLVIEDSANGVRAAKAAGMKVVGYRNKNSGEQNLTLADVVVDNYKDFPYIKVMQN